MKQLLLLAAVICFGIAAIKWYTSRMTPNSSAAKEKEGGYVLDSTKTDGTTETLARNVRFKMTPAKLGAKAFTRAADRTSWQWITASESTTHNK